MTKQEIQNKIDDLEKQLTELKEKLNKPEPKMFEPKYGDTYYLITGDGTVYKSFWYCDEIDALRYAIGNRFETKERAEFEVERLKVITELEQFADEHNELLDWNNDTHIKFTIVFDRSKNCIIYCGSINFMRNDIYFSSEEIAKQAVEKVGEDRLKKYYFGLPATELDLYTF